jgi:beta-lactamase class A
MSPRQRGLDFLHALRSGGYGGEVGLYVTDLDGVELATLNADRVFPAASLIKVPLLLNVLERAQQGELDLDGRHTMHASDRVSGAGVLHELDGGLSLTLRDLLTLMIIVSDNTATNLVIELLGVEAVNAWLSAQDYVQTRLVGKLQLPPELKNEAQRRGERNTTSAAEQGRLFLDLWRGARLDEAHRELGLSILGRQQYRDILARKLPHGKGGERLHQTFTKSGELTGVHHDAGLLLLPRPLGVTLLSEGGSDPSEHPENGDVLALANALYPLLAELGGL